MAENTPTVQEQLDELTVKYTNLLDMLTTTRCVLDILAFETDYLKERFVVDYDDKVDFETKKLIFIQGRLKEFGGHDAELKSDEEINELVRKIVGEEEKEEEEEGEN